MAQVYSRSALAHDRPARAEPSALRRPLRGRSALITVGLTVSLAIALGIGVRAFELGQATAQMAAMDTQRARELGIPVAAGEVGSSAEEQQMQHERVLEQGMSGQN